MQDNTPKVIDVECKINELTPDEKDTKAEADTGPDDSTNPSACDGFKAEPPLEDIAAEPVAKGDLATDPVEPKEGSVKSPTKNTVDDTAAKTVDSTLSPRKKRESPSKTDGEETKKKVKTNVSDGEL